MEEEIKKGVGYDFKTKNTAPTAYKCLICHLLIRGCTELPCGHSYCRECLERWEELKIQENKKLKRYDCLRCMLCYKDYKVEGKQFPKTVDNIITTELEVLCKHSESGCEWHGVIIDFKEHQGKCEMCPIKCSNEKCEETLSRNQIDEHQKLKCLYEEISCPFNKAGCDFKTLRCEMENHTTKFNTIHTQLLLQMQIDNNIQDLKERLHSTQNELQTTKTTLAATQNELQTTKDELKATQFKLEQTMEELNRAKEDTTKRENEIKFLQENIENKIVNGFKLNHQITEILAKRNIHKMDLNEIFESLETKQPIIPVSSIQPFEINGTYLEFPNINELVRDLSRTHEEKLEMMLKKMLNGRIHHIDDKQLIFKLDLPKNLDKLHVDFDRDVSLLTKNFAKNVVVKNNQLVLLESPFENDDYQIFIQIKDYNNLSSNCYLYRKSENVDNLLLENNGWIIDINMEDYRTPSNEILVHITK